MKRHAVTIAQESGVYQYKTEQSVAEADSDDALRSQNSLQPSTGAEMTENEVVGTVLTLYLDAGSFALR